MHDYIAKRIAELEAHAREVQTELTATLTVVAELRQALQHESVPPPSPESDILRAAAQKLVAAVQKSPRAQ